VQPPVPIYAMSGSMYKSRQEKWNVPESGDVAMEKEFRPTPVWILNVLYFLHEGARMLLLRFMTAYFTSAGIDTKTVGLLQVFGCIMAFVGEYTWGLVADSYLTFQRTVFLCNMFGIAFFLCLPFCANTDLKTLCAFYGLANFGLSWVGIRDAFAVSSLESLEGSPEAGARQFGRVRKFAAFGWGMSGLMTGALQDTLGTSSVFGFFVFMEFLLMFVIGVYVVEPPAAKPAGNENSTEAEAESEQNGGLLGVFKQPHTLLFMANLIVYGTCTALQEVYEFVYLLKGFQGTTSSLLGLTLVVMTISEIPVFHYADKLISAGFVPVYMACHVIMSVRCFLYSLLPHTAPALVLLIEPLHGATFAAMWSASVEYGRREAPAGCRSRMQALVSGTYFQVSQILGSMLWGFIITFNSGPEGKHDGFRPSYQQCAFALAVWSVVWNVAVFANGPSPLNQGSYRSLPFALKGQGKLPAYGTIQSKSCEPGH